MQDGNAVLPDWRRAGQRVQSCTSRCSTRSQARCQFARLETLVRSVLASTPSGENATLAPAAFAGGIMLSPKYLEENFRTVRKNTIVVAEDIPADNYTFIAAPGVKSVGEMLAHLAVSPRWQMELHTRRRQRLSTSRCLPPGSRARGRTNRRCGRRSRSSRRCKDGGEQFAAFLAGLSAATLGRRSPSRPRFSRR